MFKKICLITLLISLVFLNSCSIIGYRLFNLSKENDSTIAGEKFEQIINALNNRDIEIIKSMFSEKALNEADDINRDLDYLIEFIPEKIESWKQTSQGVNGSNDHGKKVKKVRTWYTVNTNFDEYIFLIVEYLIDAYEPKNVGLYMLQVLKSEDRDKYNNSGEKNLKAGIWLPPDLE